MAYYFGWMNFYHTCGFIPALAGVAMYLYRWFKGATVDTDPYLPFFSVFMAIWGVLFLVVRTIKAMSFVCCSISCGLYFSKGNVQ